MSEASSATPAAPEDGSQPTGGQTPQDTHPAPEAPQPEQETPAEATGQQATEDVYDKAFEKLLGPDAGPPPSDPQAAAQLLEEPAGQSEQQPEAGTEGAGEPGEPEPQGEAPDLTDDQVQLLRRLHMTPEMIAGWTPDQQRQFLENAAKREADQTRSFKELQQRLTALEQQGTAGGSQQAQGQAQGGQAGAPGDQTAGEPAGQPSQQETPAGELAGQAQQVVSELVDVYGDEIKPLGELTTKLASTADQLQQRLDQSEQQSTAKDQLIVEMTIDSGVRDLVGEFPSLEKADVRQRVVDRFTNEWRSPESKHRTAQGPLLERVRAALRDAAAAEFGNQTESAAQVALANKTKERLRQQPQPGAGRGRAAARTQDDVYDQAFDEHLAPELRRP